MMKGQTMKSVTTMLLAGSLFLAGSAAAQGPWCGTGQGHGHGKAGMAGMNLTEEQRTKFEDLRLKHLKEIEPLRADMQKQRSSLALELTADKYNEANVKGIQNEISKTQNAIAMKSIAHRRAIRDMLTPAQQKTFDTRMLDRGRGTGRNGEGPAFGRGGRGNRGGSCRGCCN